MGRPGTRLVVLRNSPDDVQQRQVVLSLDGAPLESLLFGESVVREIEPGVHRLKAHNTLVWKTLEFEALPGEEARYLVVNRAGLGSMTLVALLGVGPLYVTLERIDAPPNE